MRDWAAWHHAYDDPASALSDRLRVVQARLGALVDERAPGPLRIVSMCAGEGRDVLPVLAERPGVAAEAVLIESDAALAARAVAPHVEVRVADAGDPASYDGALPAEVVLACGVFGNIADDDIARTIRFLAAATRPGGAVVWTRGRRPPDRTPAIRQWFADAGFAEVSFDAPEGAAWSVGVHRRTAAPAPPWPGGRVFTFR